VFQVWSRRVALLRLKNTVSTALIFYINKSVYVYIVFNNAYRGSSIGYKFADGDCPSFEQARAVTDKYSKGACQVTFNSNDPKTCALEAGPHPIANLITSIVIIMIFVGMAFYLMVEHR
jgi:hypothetical protein